MATQNGKLLAYLERHSEGVTQMEAFTALGICRLSERVREIEALGYIISHTPEKTVGGARVVRYKLVSNSNDQPSFDYTAVREYANRMKLITEFPL